MVGACDMCALQWGAAWGFGADLLAVVRVYSRGALVDAEFDVDTCHVGFGMDGLSNGNVFAEGGGR